MLDKQYNILYNSRVYFYRRNALAHITYYFERDKNKYEQVWDYSDRVTWWVSFITNWFWFTDVTEITSNKRECHKGLNSYVMVSSIILIACLIAKSYYFVDYSIWFSIIFGVVLFSVILYPLTKLMLKASWYFALYYMLFFALFDFDFGVDYLSSAALVLIYYVGLNIPGIIFNTSYFNRIAKKEKFNLVDVEVNKLSIFWLYSRFVKNSNTENLIELEKQRLIIK